MSQALSVQRDHLRRHRRLIISRALVGSLAGILPVPLLDDQISYLVQRSILRKLANAYQIDLDDEAYKALIFGRNAPPSMVDMAAGTLGYKLLSRYWRKMLLTYVTAKRAQVTSRYFTRYTLFDHYCAKLHIGLGLTRESALDLRALIDRAVENTPGTLGTRLFRRGALSAARASVRAPMELAQIVTGGRLQRLQRLLRRGQDEEIVPIAELDRVIEQQLQAQSGFFSRTVTAVELQVSVEGNPYMNELVDNFERMWRVQEAETRDGTGADESR